MAAPLEGVEVATASWAGFAVVERFSRVGRAATPGPNPQGLTPNRVADLSGKKSRAAALRGKECAIATSQAGPIAPRFLPALPPRGNRILAVVAFEA